MNNVLTQVFDQTTQTLAAPFHGRGGRLDPFGDYALLQVTSTREKCEDPGTVVWSLVGPEGSKLPRRELTPEEVNTALLELFYQQAVELHPPVPQPPLLFGNVRIQNL